MITDFEWWQIGIGVATLIVALLTYFYELKAHKLQVKVTLLETGKGDNIINRKNHDSFIFEGRLSNRGNLLIQWGEVSLLINGKKVPQRPEISSQYLNNHVPPLVDIVFIYRFGLITKIVDEKIKDIDSAKIQFSVKLHNGRVLKSKPLKFIVSE